jgi:hypothetical protein
MADKPRRKYKTHLMARPKPERVPDNPRRMRPTQVAAYLGCRYQRARDRMLAGEFGPPEYASRRLTVSRDAVLRVYMKEEAARKVKRSAAVQVPLELPKS